MMCHCALLLAAGVWTAAAQKPIDLASVPGAWRTVNRPSSVTTEGDRRVLRFEEQPPDGLVWDTRANFADGEIELDVRGRDVLQKSFLGVAFRIANDSMYDMIYVRPFNFRAADSTRHAHAVQYVSSPSYGWERLRTEHPGMYEAAIVPAPRPDDWVHVRLEVRGKVVRVFINRAATPALTVTTLSDQTHGGVGLWVGPQSDAAFSNLVIRPSR